MATRRTRHERRALARQQAKHRGRPAARLPVLLVPPATLAVARVVPTHGAGCAHDTAKRVSLADGSWITNRDFAAWHEAGHAVADLALGVAVLSLQIYRADPALIDPRLDLWEGFCRHHGPPGMDRQAVYRAVATSAIAGPVAATVVRTGLGLVGGPHPTEDENPGDAAVLTHALDVLDIPQDARSAFTLTLRNEAAGLLYRRRGQFGALVAALLRHHTLNMFELLAIWSRAEDHFPGRIGELVPCPHRNDMGDRDALLFAVRRARFGCTATSVGGERIA